MSDQRFKYYTGYEVDNEPSDDDDDGPCNTAIKNKCASSESSDDEFDKPIRDFVEKNMFQKPTNSNQTSKTTTFADEMEDELDQIYHNFISRGTFDLPISTQKTVNKKQDNEESDSENDEKDEPLINPSDQEKINDDLLYDPDEEEEDEKWMNNERIKSQGGTTEQKVDPSLLGPTDAVLNCPGCMVLLSHDCQRHETNKNQYRAMFVFNCTIDEKRTIDTSTPAQQKSRKNMKSKHNKRFKTNEMNASNTNTDTETESQDIIRPVLCSECGTEVGVYEPAEELYHFANVLVSH